jgi:hypothetical protein
MSAKRVGRCLALLLFLNQWLVYAAFAAPGDQFKDLPLKEFIQLGLKNSQDIQDAKSEVAKKNAELVQAQYAVKSEEAKDASLFAKPRNLSKDLLIRLKIPEARKQQLIATEALRSKTLAVQYEIEKLYWNAVQGKLAESAAVKKLDTVKGQLESVRTKQKFGLADQAARDQAEKALEQAASALKLAQLSYKSSLLALGDKAALDLQGGVQLSYVQDYADLNQTMLEKFTSSAQKTNLSLLQDREDRRLADMKVDTSRKLYASKFGEARMRVIESMYKSKDIDYDLFVAGYDATLEGIKEDWEGFMWLAIFPIPKVLLQGEYDGLRYFDDIRQSLPISMMDQNKAVLKEKDSLKNVILALRQSYLDAKGAEEAYAQTLRDRDKAVEAVGTAGKKAKLGFMKPEELQLVLDAKDQAELTALNGWISYKLALGKLNVDTGGAVEQTYKEGILPYREIDDGLAKINPAAPEAKGLGGGWDIKQTIGTLVSEFSIKADKKLEASDYAVFTAGGKQIGKKESIKKPLVDLSVVLSEPESLKVILYKNQEVVAESTPAGYGASGTLKLDPPGEFAALPAVKEAASASKQGEAAAVGGTTLMIGTYRVALEALTPELYNAAKGTMTDSGQGVLVKSELTGGVWVSSEQALDINAMANPKGAAIVTTEKLAAMKLTVDVSPSGKLAPLLSAAQIAVELEALKKEQEQLKLDKEAALAASKAVDTLQLSVKLKESETKTALLQALLSGDQTLALKQIAMLNNPEALVKQLEAEAAAGAGAGGTAGGGAGTGGTGSGAGTGGTGSGAGGTAGGEASPAVLEQRKEELELKVKQALASGDSAAAAAQLASLMETAGNLAVLESGSVDSTAALQDAKVKLQDALKTAQEQKDMGKTEQLQASIASLNDMMLTVQKEALFAKLDAISGLSAQLLKDEQGNIPLAAQLPPALESLLSQESKLTLEQIRQKELEKYTPEQLQELAAAAAQIEQALGGTAQIFPVESVISPDLMIHFPVPPVIINGKAFLPVRPVSEAFGAAVIWDAEQRSVTISVEDSTVVCSIDNPVAYVDGEPVSLDTTPALVAGSTFVPLRFVAEMIGMQVDWDDATKTIRISTE